MAMSIDANGVYLSGNDDLAQSLALYFRTPKGSICLHPELGFAIFDYVDKNISTVLKIIREVRTGIALWDKRITVIKAEPTFETGKLKMAVSWYPTNDSSNIIQQSFFI